MNHKAHLLIVDDDKELCSLLSKFLTGQGYRVSIAHDGLAMTDILAASRIDLVASILCCPAKMVWHSVGGYAQPARYRSLC